MKHVSDMKNKEFKKVFNSVAIVHGFSYLHSIWYAESKECILVLELEKSNFSNIYYLTLKIFIQSLKGETYGITKELRKEWGHVIRRQASEYDQFLDLDVPISIEARKQGLEDLFNNFILPFSERALSRQGILELAKDKKIVLSPVVEKELREII